MLVGDLQHPAGLAGPKKQEILIPFAGQFLGADPQAIDNLGQLPGPLG
jgi:hypothetical protein